jgi:hypothetical protein
MYAHGGVREEDRKGGTWEGKAMQSDHVDHLGDILKL